MIYRSCSRCGKIHNANHKCYANSKQYYQNPNPEIRKFRNSTAWTKKAEEIKELDKYLCQICLSKNIFNFKSLSVHHITPLAEDMSKSLENSNLITVCDTHHKECEQGKISRETQRNIISRREIGYLNK